MFDLLVNLLTIILSILFPVFASYKALQTHDPALLTPWLSYWVVLSLALTVESTFSFLLSYLPLYSWARLLLHLYLLLPGQQQGASFVYTTYVQPFLADHELQIEQLISTGHDRAKTAGLDYLKRLMSYLKAQLLGQIEDESSMRSAPTPPTPPAQQQGNYAQTLLDRFSLPSARAPTAAAAGDIYTLLSSALQAATAATSGSSAKSTSGTPSASSILKDADLAASQTLIPPALSSPADRLSYISAQRDRLLTLLHAFDKEADDETLAQSMGGLSAGAKAGETRLNADGGIKQSRSETDFEAIEHEEAGTGTSAGSEGMKEGNLKQDSAKKGWGWWAGEKKAASTRT